MRRATGTSTLSSRPADVRRVRGRSTGSSGVRARGSDRRRRLSTYAALEPVESPSGRSDRRAQTRIGRSTEQSEPGPQRDLPGGRGHWLIAADRASSWSGTTLEQSLSCARAALGSSLAALLPALADHCHDVELSRMLTRAFSVRRRRGGDARDAHATITRSGTGSASFTAPACDGVCTGELTCPDGTLQFHSWLEPPERRAVWRVYWCPSEGEAPAVTGGLIATAFRRLPLPPVVLLDPTAGWTDAGELRDQLLHRGTHARPDRPAARAAGGPADLGALLHLALRRWRGDHDEQAGRAVPEAADHAQLREEGRLPARRWTRPGLRTTGSVAARGSRYRAA